MNVKPTILVVDDDAMQRSAFYEMLSREGFRCMTAANAIDALQIIEANIVAVDLLATDVKVPGALNGLDLANRVRELQPQAAILMITGYADDPILKDIVARGYRVLEKPFRVHHLIAAIKEELAKQESQRSQLSEGGPAVPLNGLRELSDPVREQLSSILGTAATLERDYQTLLDAGRHAPTDSLSQLNWLHSGWEADVVRFSAMIEAASIPQRSRDMLLPMLRGIAQRISAIKDLVEALRGDCNSAEPEHGI